VRRRVLEDHERLRGELERLEGLAEQILREAEAEMLRAESEQFLERLLRHMRWEESYLLPALLDADAWGRERAARLERDHREQRELFAFILERLRDGARPTAVVARDVCNLVDLLRDDMREEEQDLLDERVLRDDVVGIDVETG